MWIIFGVLATIVWIFLGWYYASEIIGLENFLIYNPDEIGIFLIGLFGPLAFFWLLAIYFRQRIDLRRSAELRELQAEELRHNVDIVEHQARTIQDIGELAEKQAHIIEENERVAKRDIFMRFAELTTEELNTIAVEIVRETAPDETMQRTEESFEGGYKNAFFSLLVRSLTDQEIDKVTSYLQKTVEFPDNIVSFRDKFDRMIEEATACDADGYFQTHFESSAMGKLNDIFRNVELNYFSQEASD